MSTECCICTKPDDLDCPACDQSFCISCFVDHATACRDQLKKQAEKRCSVCGRYASINPTVHCSDCQIEICRSCLYAHRKQHKIKKKCSHCFGDIVVEGNSVVCGNCNEWFHKGLCFNAHKAVHEQKHQEAGWQTCIQCKREYSLAYAWVYCSQCKQRFCLKCSTFHQETYAQSYNTRREYGRINLDDFKINFDSFKINVDEDLLKNLCDAMDWAKSDEAQQQAKAEAERLKHEEAQRARQQKEQEEFFRRFWDAEQRSYYSSYSDAYQQHSQSQQHREKQQSYNATSGASHELTAAFSLLQLSTRATVQEVKRAFKRKAKQYHPDVGGSQEAFIKLTNAYELALAHAERNER